MAILTPEKLVELRELAKAATPGPWSLDPMFGVVVADAGVITETRDFPRCDNARFIAAANPETVLALLEAAAELAQLGWVTDQLESGDRECPYCEAIEPCGCEKSRKEADHG